MSEIDVSKCIYYFDDKCRCMNSIINQDFYKDPLCEEVNDCYYKQLQQLKQENELLKNERTIDLRNQLEKLKAEN